MPYYLCPMCGSEEYEDIETRDADRFLMVCLHCGYYIETKIDIREGYLDHPELLKQSPPAKDRPILTRYS